MLEAERVLAEPELRTITARARAKAGVRVGEPWDAKAEPAKARTEEGIGEGEE